MTEPNLDEQIEPIKPKFLDLVENHWASEENPHRIGIFIRKGNRTGRLNPGQFLAFTDGKGGFWEIGNRKGHKMVIIGNLIANQVREARIDELKQIEPPEQYIDYAMISGNDACAMCGFNAIKFREYIEDRTATLKGVKKK